ncbi:MAG TPA: DUF6152 family protein [Gammaproteobacteria bacterium]
MTIYRLLIVCFGVALFAAPAHAHHAWAAVFTDEYTEIEGYVTEYNFKNPHVNIMLSVMGEDGVETEWMATGPAAPPFRRWGWSEKTVEVGQYLRLRGRTSRTGAPMIVMVGDDIQAGTFLELDPSDGSVVRAVVGNVTETAEPTEVATLPLRLSDGRPNFTGTWLGGPRGGRPPAPFNEVGAALQADFDALNDPAFATCSDPGIVRQVAFTPHPMRVMQDDDRIVFEYEEHGGRRVIYLDGRGPETAEHTRFGHHVARYEGDTLVIESSQLLGNLASGGGNALSDQTTTVETYRRVDDPDIGAMIEMSMEITDPGHLTEPWNIRWVKIFAPEGLDFIEVDCKLPLAPNP